MYPYQYNPLLSAISTHLSYVDKEQELIDEIVRLGMVFVMLSLDNEGHFPICAVQSVQ